MLAYVFGPGLGFGYESKAMAILYCVLAYTVNLTTVDAGNISTLDKIVINNTCIINNI